MSIELIRFRHEGDFVVLQVFERAERTAYSYGDDAKWRDAKVEDLLEVARYTRAHDALDTRLATVEMMLQHAERRSHIPEQDQV